MDSGFRILAESHQEEIELIRGLVDTVPAMLGYWDTGERCHFANKAYEIWFGVAADSLIGTSLKELLGVRYGLQRRYIEGVLKGEAQEFEQEIPDPNGGASRYGQTYYIPKVVDGQIKGFFAFVADITQRKRLEEALQQAKDRADALATHDALTGLPNRLLLIDRLSRAIPLAQRQKRKCAILFVDLDGFKQVNDSLGHAAGDALLCAFASRMVSLLRKSDTVARLGGDEFVVFLPDVDHRAQAGSVAEKLLSGMTHSPLEVGAHSITQRFSIGISTFPEDGSDIDELIAKADAALYEAKQAGRHRYAFSKAMSQRP